MKQFGKNDKLLLEKFGKGDARALSRIITAVEDETARGKAFLRELYPRSGSSYIIGITGAPGVGKSTLTEGLVGVFRAQGNTVGVIAVDPTSPFSGGAILGDRIRMQKHFTDPGVFIRSAATRGHMGGMSRATGDIAALMDAFGFDIILIETVGVGQDEVDVIDTAFTSIVVLVPGLGDDIQHIKAGIMEVADIFVINKADRPGADRIAREVRMMLELGARERDREVPVLPTVARTGEGIEDLASAVVEHRGYLAGAERLESLLKERSGKLLSAAADEVAARSFLEFLKKEDRFAGAVEKLASREIDARSLAEELFSVFRKNPPKN